MSDSPKQCDFLLMGYVPDPFKNEFVNIGVMLLGRHEDFAGVRFTRDWSRVRCLDPYADLDILEALEEDIADQLQGNESRAQFVYGLQDPLSNGLQLSEAKAPLSQSPEKDLSELPEHISSDHARPARHDSEPGDES